MLMARRVIVMAEDYITGHACVGGGSGVRIDHRGERKGNAMRNLALALLAGFLAPAHAADRIVNLDSPGALAAIERESPEHYRKIVDILRVSATVSCETLPKILHVQYGVTDTQCNAFAILTSLPPKRDLFFTIGRTGYRTHVVLRGYEGRVMPAK
jgi:hypothetical protein